MVAKRLHIPWEDMATHVAAGLSCLTVDETVILLHPLCLD